MDENYKGVPSGEVVYNSAHSALHRIMESTHINVAHHLQDFADIRQLMDCFGRSVLPIMKIWSVVDSARIGNVFELEDCLGMTSWRVNSVMAGTETVNAIGIKSVVCICQRMSL